ncbi:MAG: sigma-54-dependent Fis family transcriptional regulator [Planctomycetes bacterium]|nr:sigma-54-dependent Fis family transcriptional regulator [Planctomycetota bacterium]
MAKIVIIEDEENLRFSIAKRLQKAGHTTVESDTVEEALDLIEKDEPDAILTDINLAGKLNGLDLVRTVRENGFGGSVIVMTAYGSIENAIEAIKDGADEYLPKPISLEEVCLVLDRSLGNHKVRNQLTLYQRLARSKSKERSLLGESPAWQDVVSLAQRMAHLPVASGNELSAILLMGETGVGKGRLARYIHDNCPDPSAPFVHVNCSALPPTLIESELFGHQKGAFTDARETRQGLFELADGGTIFLDEIGDMPLEPQSKLLIVVEQGVYRRIGATSERKANARIIAATNADLMNRVEDGTFRRDLFYRLNPLTISIPSLRERGDDAVILAKHLLASASAQGTAARTHVSSGHDRGHSTALLARECSRTRQCHAAGGVPISQR